MSDVADRTFAATTSPHELAYDRTGPGTPAGRYLRQFWTPVAEVTELAPGKARAITIMSERFTLYRGETGAYHLLEHLCPHRHVALSTGRIEGDFIRCFYHGWKFDGDGQCVEQPAEDVSFAAKVRARAYPVREYLGLVYAYLGEGEPPQFPRFKRLERPGTILNWGYVRRTNFFNSLENSADHAHANFVHARSAFTTKGVNREIPETEAEEVDCGMGFWTKYTDGNHGHHFIVMPLAAYIVIADDDLDTLIDHLAYRVPIDDDSHRTFIINLIELFGDELERYMAKRRARQEALKGMPSHDEVVAAVIRGDLHIDDVPERADLVGIQDSVVMETQPPVSERPPDRLARSDRAVILLRRIYTREIEAFAAGRAIKRWSYPDDLGATPAV